MLLADADEAGFGRGYDLEFDGLRLYLPRPIADRRLQRVPSYLRRSEADLPTRRPGRVEKRRLRVVGPGAAIGLIEETDRPQSLGRRES